MREDLRELDVLEDEIHEAILTSPWASGAPDERDWDDLARRLHALQRRTIEAYGRWCEARRDAVTDATPLERIPAVPTAAFKRFRLFARGEPTRCFRTSGTSDGARRGESPFSERGLALMDAAIDVNAARMLFPGDARARLLALAPSPELDPERIMSHGLARLMRRFGLEGGAFLVKRDGLDLEGAVRALAGACEEGVAVALVGATFALPPLLDLVERLHGAIELPAGSLVMDAGGMKGRGGVVDAATLRARLEERLGIPAPRSVNLLGMTELASQLYDDRLAAAHEGRAPLAGKRPPPWCRTWSVDPSTLEALPAGRVGVLRHMDLANVERPAFVQTDDLGRVHADGSFEILGRASEAEARGCSLDVEEWLAADGGGTPS